MKNFIKFLGIISLVLVIGFSMVACGDDEEDDTTTTTTGGGGGAILPAELTPREDATSKYGTWTSSTDSTLSLRFTTSGNYSFVYIGTSQQAYDVISVEGKKIVVKKDAADGVDTVLCDNYQITGGIVVFANCAGDFEDFKSKPLTLVTN